MVTPLVPHGGNVHAIARAQGRAVSRVIDFSASINPLGLSRVVRRAMRQAVCAVVHYPDVAGEPLRTQLAEIHGICADHIVLGNGSAELISVLPRALGIRHGLVVGPTFMEFERALKLAGALCTYVHANRDDSYRPPIDRVCAMLARETAKRQRREQGRARNWAVDTVFLCHPNSPTGQVITQRQMHQLLESIRRAHVRLVVDEAFIDYCASRSVLKSIGRYEELIVMRSLTKFFAIPGLRLGYLVGPAALVTHVRSLLPPWSVNVMASAAASAALQDTDYRCDSLDLMNTERTRFRIALCRIPGVRVYPSAANFLLVELDAECRVSKLVGVLRQQGLLIRNCEDFAGIDEPTIRLAVRRPQENDRLAKVLKRELARCR